MLIIRKEGGDLGCVLPSASNSRRVVELVSDANVPLRKHRNLRLFRHVHCIHDHIELSRIRGFAHDWNGDMANPGRQCQH